jgi:hypothetical protein
MVVQYMGSRPYGNRWETEDLIFLGDRDVRSWSSQIASLSLSEDIVSTVHPPERTMMNDHHAVYVSYHSFQPDVRLTSACHWWS